MGWKVKLSPEARVHLTRVGAADATRILRFLYDRLERRDDPRKIGKPLKGSLREYWRYRVGDYRVICRLDDEIVTVLVIHIGHRSKVYTL